MICFSLPTSTQLNHFLDVQSRLSFTYKQVGQTQEWHPEIPGFNLDTQRVKIGQGEAAFERAKQAIRLWLMFPAPWTRLLPGDTPIREGNTVAMFARFSGIWWRNACRIVYTVEQPTRYGFAYGTLPGHVECGEELFCVEIEPEGSVWYEIRAFSRPRHWLAWLGYPLIRQLQARFRRDSAAQMQAFTLQKSDPA